MTPPYVAVCGPGSDGASEAVLRDAEAAGRELALAGAVVVTGGLGGAMEAACRGASSAGGVAVGVLPGRDRAEANPWVTVALATGLGELRNGVVVASADAIVAIRGGWGTLSEVALALKTGVPVVGVGDWGIDEVEEAPDGAAAARRALALIGARA